VNRYTFAGLVFVALAALIALFRGSGRRGIKTDSVPQSVLNRIRAEHPFDAGH
jgi:hypothetical protein